MSMFPYKRICIYICVCVWICVYMHALVLVDRNDALGVMSSLPLENIKNFFGTPIAKIPVVYEFKTPL